MTGDTSRHGGRQRSRNWIAVGVIVVVWIVWLLVRVPDAAVFVIAIVGPVFALLTLGAIWIARFFGKPAWIGVLSLHVMTVLVTVEAMRGAGNSPEFPAELIDMLVLGGLVPTSCATMLALRMGRAPRDPNQCPTCGYDCGPAASSRCPECGHDFGTPRGSAIAPPPREH